MLMPDCTNWSTLALHASGGVTPTSARRSIQPASSTPGTGAPDAASVTRSCTVASRPARGAPPWRSRAENSTARPDCSARMTAASPARAAARRACQPPKAPGARAAGGSCPACSCPACCAAAVSGRGAPDGAGCWAPAGAASDAAVTAAASDAAGRRRELGRRPVDGWYIGTSVRLRGGRDRRGGGARPPRDDAPQWHRARRGANELQPVASQLLTRPGRVRRPTVPHHFGASRAAPCTTAARPAAGGRTRRGAGRGIPVRRRGPG
jgi:hypothetical protein